MKVVAHFVRKKGQINAPFISNQIKYLSDFAPIIFCRTSKLIKSKTTAHFGGFSTLEISAENLIDLSNYSIYRNEKINLLNYYISIKLVKKIHMILKERKVDILHFHYGSDAILFYKLLRTTLLPSIVSFYGYDATSFPNSFFGYGKYLLKNYLFRYITKVLVMSDDMKQDLITIGCPKDKIMVHYPGEDIIDLSTRISRNNNKKGFINLTIIGNLVEKKGHKYLIQAFKSLLKDGYKNLVLNIYGDGPQKKQIEELIKKLGLTKFIKLYPSVNYLSQEMITAFQNTDIFIHPSITTSRGEKEGIPGTIIEAMSTGLPIVSTYHAGIPSVIKNNITGVLVQEGAIDELKNTLVALIKDSSKRRYLGENAKKFALENLTIQNKINDLEKIYHNIILLEYENSFSHK